MRSPSLDGALDKISKLTFLKSQVITDLRSPSHVSVSRMAWNLMENPPSMMFSFYKPQLFVCTSKSDLMNGIRRLSKESFYDWDIRLGQKKRKGFVALVFSLVFFSFAQ